MRKLIVLLAVLCATAVWAYDTATMAELFGVSEAYVTRACRAVAWAQGKSEPVTPDEVAAEMLSRLHAIVVQQETAHGIDPETQAQTPQALISALEAERAAKVAAETQKEAAAAALVTVTAERDSLKAVLAAPKVAEPVEEVPEELTP